MNVPKNPDSEWTILHNPILLNNENRDAYSTKSVTCMVCIVIKNDFNLAVFGLFQTSICITIFYRPKLLSCHVSSNMLGMKQYPNSNTYLLWILEYSFWYNDINEWSQNVKFCILNVYSLVFAPRVCAQHWIYIYQYDPRDLICTNSYQSVWHKETQRHHQASSLGSVMGMNICDTAITSSFLRKSGNFT